MMLTFIDVLRCESSAFQALTGACQTLIIPAFGDLLWPGDDLDFEALIRDPGITFTKDANTFALMRTREEIRYYAGSDKLVANTKRCELGRFPNEHTALSFGVVFLLKQVPLEVIAVEREIRYQGFHGTPKAPT
jgi:hypothetical protein